MTDNNDFTTIEERYSSAINTSNLRVEADKGGAADVLIAVGWSSSRIGAALMRLHTKADRNALEQVHGQLSARAERWGIERPVVVAAAVLSWWLSHVCKTCNGVRFELIPGTPALSNRQCKICRGSGESEIPHGQAGKRLAAFMDHCKDRGAQSIQSRLRNTRK